MKKACLLMLLFANYICFAQVPDTAETPEKRPGQKEVQNPADLENQPEFPGGLANFFKFFDKSYNPEKTTKKDFTGKVYIAFVVETDGSVTNIQLLRDPGFGIGREAVRVMGLSPKWLSGKINKKPVRAKYNLPIAINPSLETSKQEPKMTALERLGDDNVAVPDFKEKDPKENENRVYIMPDLDVKPSFPGGSDAFLKFFDTRFDKKILKANGWVFFDFIIEKDGSTSFKIVKSSGVDVEAEAARILSKMPKFSPGKRDGKEVRSTFSQRFNIVKP